MERITRMFVLILALSFSGLAAAEYVDINSADSQTLADALQGVGESKAQAIVAYRKANGPFRSAEELTQVKGIGERILELNRGTISVGSADRR